MDELREWHQFRILGSRVNAAGDLIFDLEPMIPTAEDLDAYFKDSSRYVIQNKV